MRRRSDRFGELEAALPETTSQWSSAPHVAQEKLVAVDCKAAE
jgi:hypothetical protein